MGILKPRFEKCPLAAKKNFRDALGAWFSAEGKDYPWRRTHEAYPILVSEVMLQQTQIATVLGKGYYTRFLEKFPDLNSLAGADDESLLKAWEGLGYYRRARMLRATAITVLERHDGVFPDDENSLLALPGIGPYTAAALLAFAFGMRSGLVDGNVSRVLSRLMDDREIIDSSASQARHRKWSADLCDPDHPRRHHYAMMELGQTICRSGVPRCELCPVAKFCAARDPEELPVKKARAKISNIIEHAIWARNGEGSVLLHLESGSRREGLWKLPLRTPAECAALRLIAEDVYPITRYRVSLKIFLTDGADIQEGDEWISPERLDSLPMASPFRRVVRQLCCDL